MTQQLRGERYVGYFYFWANLSHESTAGQRGSGELLVILANGANLVVEVHHASVSLLP